MFKKTLIAIVALLVLLASQPLRGSTDVNWVGGEGRGEWSNPDNWNPPVAPDGDYVVNITCESDFNDLVVFINQYYQVKELNCYGTAEYGEFELDGGGVEHAILFCVPNGLNNYSTNLEVQTITIGSDIANTSGAGLRLDNMECWGDLYNFGSLDVAGEVEVGNVRNEAPFSIKPHSELWAEDFNNTGSMSLMLSSELYAENIVNHQIIELKPDGVLTCDGELNIEEPNGIVEFIGATVAANSISLNGDTTLTGFGQVVGNVSVTADANFVITGSTNIVGDVNISPNATLEISDGATLITGQTVCNGTIHIKGGYLIPQGGLSGDCNIIWEAGLFTNPADFNLDGKVDFGDFAYFAETWLWQTALH